MAYSVLKFLYVALNGSLFLFEKFSKMKTKFSYILVVFST